MIKSNLMVYKISGTIGRNWVTYKVGKKYRMHVKILEVIIPCIKSSICKTFPYVTSHLSPI